MTKVAIFETDHAFAVELRNELTRFGCTVQVFTDGTSGLTAAKSTPPDLILVSAELPPVNGFSTCNKIKKDAKLASVPIILMSSQSSQETFEQHRRLPSRADDYIHKPISFADFLPHIQKLVRLQGAHQIADEDTSMVMDEEVLIVEDSAFDEPSSGTTDGKRPTLELEIGEATIEPMTHRQPGNEPLAGRDEAESLEEELETIVGERPNIPDHLMEQYRAAMRGSGPQAAKGAESKPAGASKPPPEKSAPPRGSGAPGAWRSSSASPASSAPSAPAPASSPPGAASADNLIRAKNALQTALAQLNQARKESASLREQLTAAQGQSGETQRLKGKLERAKAAEREVLDLREQIQARDKELVATREKLSAKEREVLAAKDGTLTVERSMSDLKDRLLKVETENNAANARVEALVADKALSDKRAEDFKAGARKIAEQLNHRAKELTDLQQAHQSALDRLKREHQTALQQAEDKRRKELADAEKSHREQLDRVNASVESKTGKAEETTKAKLETVQQQAAKELERAKKQGETALEQAQTKAARELETAKKEGERKLESAQKAHARELEQLQKKLDQALKNAGDAKDKISATSLEHQNLKKQQNAEVAKLVEEHKQNVKVLEEHHKKLEREHTKALEKAGYDHQEKLLQKEKSLAALKEQLEKDLAEASTEIDNLKNQLQELNEASQVERREHDDQVAALTAQGADLQAELKRLQTESGKQQAQLQTELAKLQTQLQAQIQVHAPVAEQLAVAEKKLEKARTRWGQDRSELKQVKNNLAALVRALDEAIVKDIEE